MSDNRQVAATLLTEAGQTILKRRPGVHGSAENSFAMIGELWTVYLRHVFKVRKHDNILPEDVSQMMSMLKKARATYGDTTNPDNFVDDIGYAALAGMLQLPDPNKTEDDEKIDSVANDIAAELDKKSGDGFAGVVPPTKEKITGRQRPLVPRTGADGFAGIAPAMEKDVDA